MLSCYDWKIDLNLFPSIVFKFFLLVLFLASGLALYLTDLPSLLLALIAVVQFLLFVDCYRLYGSLRHKQAVINIVLKDEQWHLSTRDGACADYGLERLLLTRYCIVLGLKRNKLKTVFGKSLSLRHYQLVFRDQLLLDDFKKLFVFLKFSY